MSHFDDKKLFEFVINGIIPIINTFKMQIATSDKKFIINLLKPEEGEILSQYIDFIQIL